MNTANTILEDIKLSTAPEQVQLETFTALVDQLAQKNDQSSLLALLLQFPFPTKERSQTAARQVAANLVAALLRLQISRGDTEQHISRTLQKAGGLRVQTTDRVRRAVWDAYRERDKKLGNEVPWAIVEKLEYYSNKSSAEELFGYRCGFVVAARRCRPMEEVLRETKWWLARGLYPEASSARSALVRAMLGPDIYRPEDVQRIAHELGADIDSTVWGQAVFNAAQTSGPAEAAALIAHVYSTVPDGIVPQYAAHNVICKLIGRSDLRLASTDELQLAFSIFMLQDAAGPKALGVRPKERRDYIPLLAALKADIAYEQRESAIEEVLLYQEAHHLGSSLATSQDDALPAETMAAILRSKSHEEAVLHVLSSPAHHPMQLHRMISFVMRIRFADATVMPFSAFQRARSVSATADQTGRLFTSYVQSIQRSLVQLHFDGARGAAPLKHYFDGESSILGQHLRNALAILGEVERSAVDVPGLNQDRIFLTALLGTYEAHRGARADVERIEKILVTLNNTGDLPPDQALQLRMLSNSPNVSATWDDIMATGGPASTRVSAKYVHRLVSLQHFEKATEFTLNTFVDDPKDQGAMLALATLFAAPLSLEDRNKLATQFPLIRSDASSRETTMGAIRHRAKIGKATPEQAFIAVEEQSVSQSPPS